MPEVRDVKPALTKHEEAEEEQRKRDEVNKQKISDLSEEEKLVSHVATFKQSKNVLNQFKNFQPVKAIFIHFSISKFHIWNYLN